MNTTTNLTTEQARLFDRLRIAANPNSQRGSSSMMNETPADRADRSRRYRASLLWLVGFTTDDPDPPERGDVCLCDACVDRIMAADDVG